MARILAVMYQTDPWAWHHVPTLTSDKGGDTVKSRHWGLIESKDGERDDGNPRNGFWRLTDLGRRFVRGEVTVSKWAILFHEECHGLDGPPVTISDALGEPFHYTDMIR